MSTHIRGQHWDAIVVGARCAGAATAMLLARAGLDVLVLDAGRAGTDTLSTHALMRAGVVQLHRWDLLEEIIDSGTPEIRGTDFSYSDGHRDSVEIHPGDGITGLRAPRRTVLDPVLARAAERAGAILRYGVRVHNVVRDASGAVTGVEWLDRRSATVVRDLAPIVVGADGRQSMIAARVGAGFTRNGTAAGAIATSYWTGPELDRYQWHYRPGATAGLIPTNDGRVCVWAGIPATRFADELAGDLPGGYARLLASVAPDVADQLSGATRHGPVRGYPGAPGFVRQAAGPGWALVGDAGYFKDPLTAHGMTDALRDAELLARAIISAPPGGRQRVAALQDYERTRDELSMPLFDLTDRIAGYHWDLAEVRDLLYAVSAAMRAEVQAVTSFDQPAERAA